MSSLPIVTELVWGRGRIWIQVWFQVHYIVAVRFLVTVFKFQYKPGKTFLRKWPFQLKPQTQPQKYLWPQKDAVVKLTIVDFTYFLVPEGGSLWNLCITCWVQSVIITLKQMATYAKKSLPADTDFPKQLSEQLRRRKKVN